MTKKYKPLKDEEIVASLRGNISGSVTWSDNTLSAERLAVQEYYDGSKPAPSHKGNSKYISTDVYDSVENMKALLLETFAGGYNIVEFQPNGANDVEQARIATAYCDQVVFRDNDGYGVFRSAIDDGLKARIGVAKVFWEDKHEDAEEEFENVHMDELTQHFSANPDHELGDVTANVDDPNMFSGTLKHKINKSQVRIMPIPPENFLVEGLAKNLGEAFVSHKEERTRSDLILAGYDPEVIDEIALDDENAWVTDPEVLARFEGINGALNMRTSEEMQEQLQKVWVYECYVEMDVEGKGTTRLWKFTVAGNTLLDKEKVTRRPFVLWAPIPKAHSIYGVNYADKIIPTQNAKTVLTRGILDHTVQTTNPRYTVLKGSLMNPRELMDNRVGGLVNVTRPDGIAPLAQASLNPFVFQSIQLLDTDLEDTTGVSRLSQGLNKDVLSKQNSQALVQDVQAAGQGRQKIIARNFANDFIRPLFLMVYDLVLENEDRQRVVNVAGNWVETDPKQWKPREHLRIEFKLGAGEQDREAEKWLMIDQVMSQNPTTAPLYGLQQKYTVLSNFLARKGVKDLNNYLKPWQQAQQEVSKQPPPPDVQIAQAQLKIEETKLELEKFKAQAAHADKGTKLNLAAQKQQSDFAIKSDQLDLATREQLHKETVDNAELEILQQHADTAEVKAFASPKG
jgi:hypothetical protein